jgi:tripartite-type tricarboxylate transporter receptor subunit TctC
MTLFQSRTIRLIPVLLLLSLSTLSQAQDPAATYPNKTIKIISPFAPGGATDILARTLAQKRLQKRLMVQHCATGAWTSTAQNWLKRQSRRLKH